jgi:hypothetical protein
VLAFQKEAGWGGEGREERSLRPGRGEGGELRKQSNMEERAREKERVRERFIRNFP